MSFFYASTLKKVYVAKTRLQTVDAFLLFAKADATEERAITSLEAALSVTRVREFGNFPTKSSTSHRRVQLHTCYQTRSLTADLQMIVSRSRRIWGTLSNVSTSLGIRQHALQYHLSVKEAWGLLWFPSHSKMSVCMYVCTCVHMSVHVCVCLCLKARVCFTP